MPRNHELQDQNHFSTNSEQIVELDDDELDNITGGITSSEQARKDEQKVRETVNRFQYFLSINTFW
ncbi:bacteriocin [Scytonema sp. NUACC26]|uniref:bacteriocin n=1 Tax=Scytonema sp. NUACC26 TaxID=3140176 RepID=UPI0034DC5249